MVLQITGYDTKDLLSLITYSAGQSVSHKTFIGIWSLHEACPVGMFHFILPDLRLLFPFLWSKKNPIVPSLGILNCLLFFFLTSFKTRRPSCFTAFTGSLCRYAGLDSPKDQSYVNSSWGLRWWASYLAEITARHHPVSTFFSHLGLLSCKLPLTYQGNYRRHEFCLFALCASKYPDNLLPREDLVTRQRKSCSNCEVLYPLWLWWALSKQEH